MPTDSLSTRRRALHLALTGLAAGLLPGLACAPTPAATPRPAFPPRPQAPARPCTLPLPAGLSANDRALVSSPSEALPIVLRTPGQDGVLRHLARQLTLDDAAQIDRLEAHLRASLAASNRGVGLAAPQVGIGARAVVVMLGARSDKPSVGFYVNPRIVQRSDDVTLDYEGCLSVPDVCGMVRRNRSIVIEHGMPEGAALRIEVTGFDARIFQHEIDHLDGVLYIDRVEGGLQPKDRLKELRDQLRKEHPELAMAATVRDDRLAAL